MTAAVYTGTRNLYGEMVAAVKSLLKNSTVERVYLLIEDDEFPYPLPECVETINIAEETRRTFPPEGPNAGTQFKPLCMMRAVCARVLPESLERVLQLDVDTIVLDDLQELWDMNLTGKWFAAVPEHLGKFRPYGPKYYNLGVAMLNLREIRESGVDKRLAELLNEEELPYIDQDAWNKLGMERAAELPVRFNECFCTGHTEHPAIFHYAGILHWHHEPLVERYRSMPWSEIRGGLCVT